MVTSCIFGTETELALVVESKGVVRPAPRELASAIIEDVANRYAHATSATSPPTQHRLFLANGACVYADIGGHPEIASAECSNPIDLVSQTLALRQMLAKSTERIANVYGLPIRLIANNVDYAFRGAQSYGYHLNILARGFTLDQVCDQVAAQLASLLAAMPIVSGTGKVSFVTGSPGFEISQRAQYMAMVTGKQTTDSRAMITAKDEALCDNGIRVHLICFDTPKNPYQIALIPSIIAMALKAIESGKDIAGPVTLADPIRALHTVSCDLSLSAKLSLKHGGATTALEIHQHYIRVIREFLEQVESPEWMKQMLTLWKEVIDNLRRDSFSEGRLDWIAKLLLFTNQLQKNKLDWRQYSKWPYVLAAIRRFMNEGWISDPVRLTKTVRQREAIRHSALGTLEGYLAKHGISWEDFEEVWIACNKMCKQCLDYHRLTAEVAYQIDTKEVLTPLVTEEMIDKARTLPPTGTRATIRGEAIRNSQRGATADWTFVQQGDRRLVMTDVYGRNASWKEQQQSVRKENQ